MTAELPKYTKAEEIANSVIHGIGIIFSIAALAVLSAFATLLGSVWHIVSCSIYGATMIILYTSSTLYHSIPLPYVKSVLRTFDHSSIFLLIAGTYTPFTLVNLRGPWGWWLFGTIWGVAIIGIVFHKFISRQKPIIRSMAFVIMGCGIIAGIKPLLANVAPGGLILLFAGGLAYIIGSVIYANKRIPYNHAIWHLFVLAGTVCHFFSILFYVIPLAS
jgi:hemolysin III